MSRSTFAWLLGAAVVAVIAFVAGRALGGSGGAPSAFDLNGPAYREADLPVAYTPGRFTGFSEAGLDGRVTLSGRIRSFEADTLTLGTATGTQTLRLTGDRMVRSFVRSAAAEALRPGNSVVVLLRDNSRTAESVLLLVD
jgi:hypothetical protein